MKNSLNESVEAKFRNLIAYTCAANIYNKSINKLSSARIKISFYVGSTTKQLQVTYYS